MADSYDGSIVVVGVCAAGKSTLVRGLGGLGYKALECVQEHSYVPTLWRRHGRPHVLIYLDAGIETVCARRGVSWERNVLDVQRERLALARKECDLYIATDGLTIAQVLDRALSYLCQQPGRSLST